jgi:hypothetical protein
MSLAAAAPLAFLARSKNGSSFAAEMVLAESAMSELKASGAEEADRPGLTQRVMRKSRAIGQLPRGS